MRVNEPIKIDPDVRMGRRLYGNDFDNEGLQHWYAAEEYGYFTLHSSICESRSPVSPYGALNRSDASTIQHQRFDICLTLGCASGEDVSTLDLDIGRIIAIEPAEGYWRDHISGVPAEFRKPNLDGKIDLPDDSVDLVVALSVLHHIANVEAVVAELGRILKPGGYLLVREPISPDRS